MITTHIRIRAKLQSVYGLCIVLLTTCTTNYTRFLSRFLMHVQHPRIRSRLLLILLATSLVGLLYCLNFSLAPPIEGDAYEFAEIAQNVLEDHAWREDHVRGVGVLPHPLPLPHPPGRRGTLYVLFLLPFYAIFRERYLTVVVPYLCCHFVLPAVTYLIGRRYFTERAAFSAAIAIAIQPMLFSFGVFDPTEFLFFTILILLATDQFLRQHYVRAGILVGLSIATKEHALVFLPALLVWSIFFGRSLLCSRRIVWMFLLPLLIVTPIFLKRVQFYPNPLTCEDGAFMAGESYSMDPRTATKFKQSLSPVVGTTQDPRSWRLLVQKRCRIIWQNTRTFFTGTAYEYDVFPGIPETFSLWLSPLLLIGCLISRKNHWASFIIIMALFFILLQIVAVDFYENRYYFPLLPFAYLFAFKAFYSLQLFKRKTVSLFFIALILTTEVIPPILSRTLDAVIRSAVGESPYRELVSIGQWIQRTTSNEATFMTLPLFSPSFYFKRNTTFLPNADYLGLSTYQRVYNHEYVFAMNHVAMGSRDLFVPILRGRHFTLYSINKNQLSDLRALHPEFQEINPLGRVLHIPNDNNRFLQLHRVLLFRFSQTHKAIAAYIVIVLIGVLLFCSSQRGPLWGSIWLLAASGIFTSTTLFVRPASFLPESIDELMIKHLKLSDRHRVTLTTDMFNQRAQPSTCDCEKIRQEIHAIPNTRPDTLLIIPFPSKTREIRTRDEAVQAALEAEHIEARRVVIEKCLRNLGYHVWALDSLMAVTAHPESTSD